MYSGQSIEATAAATAAVPMLPHEPIRLASVLLALAGLVFLLLALASLVFLLLLLLLLAAAR